MPVVPGTEEPLGADVERRRDRRGSRDGIGYPLLVKAVAGGGGKGMRTVVEPARSAPAQSAPRGRRRAPAFGDAAVYLERRLTRPRHIEVQLLGDQHGTVVPFVERECSIQRRHQKVVEETPSLAVTPATARADDVRGGGGARAVGYTNAGTIEFLLDEDGRFYFLEMNTRLQVEHPVTEMVTGVDLVHWQIRIARGERLDIDPARLLTPNGHAIECRIYAEDPDNDFLPSPGRILQLRVPGGPGHPRRQRRDRRTRRADLLRPDDLEARRVGRRSAARDRAHAPRARRIRGRRHQDDAAVLHVAVRAAGFRGRRFHTTYLDECCRRATAGRSSSRRADRRVAAIAAALSGARRRATVAADAGAAPRRPRDAGRRRRAEGAALMRYEIEVTDGRR